MTNHARPNKTLILPSLLQARANSAESASRIFAREVDGAEISYRETYIQARILARSMQELGVKSGARVAAILPSSCDAVVTMCAAAVLGAIYVPLNTAYVGDLLGHALRVTEPDVVIVEESYVKNLAGIQLGELSPHLVIRGAVGALRQDETPGWRSVQSLADLRDGEDDPGFVPATADWADVGLLLFTSGTTGASKAVIVSWLHFFLSSSRCWSIDELGPVANMYSPWPMNHISGAGSIYAMAVVGGSLTLRDGWSTSRFMADILEYGCGITTLIGETVGYVSKMVPPNGAADFPLSKLNTAPISPVTEKIRETLGVDVCTNYNSTEQSAAIGSLGYDPLPMGSCGLLREGAAVRLVDTEGNDVPRGEPGELLVRTDDPAAMSTGYWGMPDATSSAWEGGFYHTGDLLRQDEEGYFYYLGRLKDRIRVRGENVSADELEGILTRSPLIERCAVVGVPDQYSDDELILFAIPATEGVLAEQIKAYCAVNLPKFMIPSRIILVSALPETPTGKVQRAVLRKSLEN